jgi:hypothetical protein
VYYVIFLILLTEALLRGERSKVMPKNCGLKAADELNIVLEKNLQIRQVFGCFFENKNDQNFFRNLLQSCL